MTTQEEINLRFDVPEQRLYSIMLYNLSSIQKGIQTQHSATDYGLVYGDTVEFKRWSQIDKTTIVLDGGGSDSFLEHMKNIPKFDIKIVPFIEPDLYGNISGFCFLVDEYVWDKEHYPTDFKVSEWHEYNGIKIAPKIKTPISIEDGIKNVGGERNYYLRMYLNKLNLAR